MGRVIDKRACPTCKAKGGDYDNNNEIVYEDTSTFCFPCRIAKRGDMGITRQVTQAEEAQNEFIQGIALPLEDRGISESNCGWNGCRTGNLGSKEVTIFEWCKDNKLIGQKCKTEDKQFFWIRRPDPLFMFNLYNPNHTYSSPIVITEGEIDALSCEEVGFQACSLVDGCGSAKRDIERDLPELLKYENIILFFDNDEPGKKAFEEVKELIPLEKLRFIKDYKGYKDANELLLAGIIDEDGNNVLNLLTSVLSQEIIEQTPPGIVYGKDIDFESLKVSNIKSIEIPWPELNKMLNGFEYGCLYLFLAGTGAGKSTALRELGCYYRNKYPELGICNFFLEENDEVTPLGYLATQFSVPLGELRRDRGLLSLVQWKEAEERILNTDRLAFINKKFEKTTENVLKDIEYLVKVKKFDIIILDHISYLIGRSGVSKHGERRDIDEFIYKLQDLTQRLGCIIIAVSHVNESDSTKRWDQGEVPNIYSGRGSKVLAQVPDGIIGLARAMNNELKCDELDLYNLKNRWFSKLGKADKLHYFSNTGRLITAKEAFKKEEK